MKNFFTKLDFWGGTSSFACAIHCAALPFFISIGALKNTTWLSHPLFEFIMISLTVFFVYKSLIKGYFNGKVSKFTFYAAITGLFLVCFHHFLGLHSTYIVAIGGLTIAVSHFLNLFIPSKA